MRNSKVFIIGFLACFVAEGVGIVPKNVLLPLFIIFSLFLYLLSLKSKKDLFLTNVWIFLAAFSYLLFLFYLSFFSLNVQVSFEFTIFLLSLFLVFLAVAKQWESIEKPFLYSLLGLGIIFCVYSFLLPFALSNNLSFFSPQSGYQYVYAMFGSNHLGEFLVFPMLITFSFFIQQKKRIFLYMFLFYFLFFLFSYSRAAYIGFVIGFVFLSFNYKHQLNAKVKKIIISFLLGTMFFFLLISSQNVWQDKVPFLSQTIQLHPKSVIETRESYILQSLRGFMQYRFYGVGLGNFEYASRMFTEIPYGWASSSHNLFLDVLTETGTISFIIFALFASILLKAIKKYHASIYAVLLLSWLSMIQFDYIHQMYSYLLLFPLFLVGMLHSSFEKHQKVFMLNLFQHLIPLFLFVFLIIYITSGLLLQKGNYKLSRTIYPLQMQAYTYDLDQKEVLDTYVRLFPGEYVGFLKLGKYYEKRGNMSQAIQNYEKAFWLDPFRDLAIAEKIYNLKKMYPGNGSEKWFADKLFRKLNNDTGAKILSNDQWLFMNKFCQKVYNFHCVYILE